MENSLQFCSAAHAADIFTTVSDITAFEATNILHRKPDMLLPNGLQVGDRLLDESYFNF
jgi:hypothetical protein